MTVVWFLLSLVAVCVLILVLFALNGLVGYLHSVACRLHDIHVELKRANDWEEKRKSSEALAEM